jgi:hypothetical protein
MCSEGVRHVQKLEIGTLRLLNEKGASGIAEEL